MIRAKEKDLLGSAAEKRIAFEIHQRDIMRHRCNFLRGDTNFVSHRICLCCLYQVPVHPLLCGHVICDLCLRASGKEARENVVRLRECPICGTIWSQGRANVEIVQKPDSCGIRVLTLDGLAPLRPPRSTGDANLLQGWYSGAHSASGASQD